MGCHSTHGRAFDAETAVGPSQLVPGPVIVVAGYVCPMSSNVYC